MMALFDQERIDQIKYNEAIGIGSFNTYTSLVSDGAISKEYAAQKLGITVAEFDKRAEENSQNQ